MATRQTTEDETPINDVAGIERGEDDEDEEGWEDAEPDVENIEVVSFFSDKRYSSIGLMLEDCKQEHGFDFVACVKDFQLDFIGAIKLVNYIRSEAKNGNTNQDVSSRSLFEDDRYMQPVLDDDAMLFSIGDVLELAGLADTNEEIQDAEAGNGSLTNGERGPHNHVAHLESELQQLRLQYAEYKSMVEKTLDSRWEEAPSRTAESGLSGSDESAEHDAGYFDSYDGIGIHDTMLKDTVRTDAYRDFIYDNKHLFQGRTILDVGCGTGILSMFCAKAGAAKVIAVDNSRIVDRARENIYNNGLADKIICLRGKIEEVTLPVDKVDIIVSEWMGYCLLYEAMLDSVLWARDRYLAPDGLMVPSHCTLFIAPFVDSELVSENVDFWRDVYGFDMSAMLPAGFQDVLIKSISKENLVAKPAPFLQLPLHDIKTVDLTFTKDFSVQLTSEEATLIDGWVIWFDTFFQTSPTDVVPIDARAESWGTTDQKGNAFTTGPGGARTHWESGILLIDRGRVKDKPQATSHALTGSITYRKRTEYKRGLDLEVIWSSGNGEDEGKQTWQLR